MFSNLFFYLFARKYLIKLKEYTFEFFFFFPFISCHIEIMMLLCNWKKKFHLDTKSILTLNLNWEFCIFIFLLFFLINIFPLKFAFFFLKKVYFWSFSQISIQKPCFEFIFNFQTWLDFFKKIFFYLDFFLDKKKKITWQRNLVNWNLIIRLLSEVILQLSRTNFSDHNPYQSWTCLY